MTDVITKEMVNLSVEGATKEEVIRALAKQIDCSGRISDFEAYYDSVIERENLTSTGIGFGIAIPHGKSDSVNQCAVGFGRVKTKIDWESLDDEPVEMVFLLAVPESSAGEEHLKIIAGLSRKLIHEEFRECLKTSTDENQIVERINESLKNIITN